MSSYLVIICNMCVLVLSVKIMLSLNVRGQKILLKIIETVSSNNRAESYFSC